MRLQRVYKEGVSVRMWIVLQTFVALWCLVRCIQLLQATACSVNQKQRNGGFWTVLHSRQISVSARVYTAVIYVAMSQGRLIRWCSHVRMCIVSISISELTYYSICVLRKNPFDLQKTTTYSTAITTHSKNRLARFIWNMHSCNKYMHVCTYFTSSENKEYHNGFFNSQLY